MANITVNVEVNQALDESQRLYCGTLDFDSSYPTGGEVVDIANNTSILFLMATPKAGYVFEWDRANQKLLAHRQKDPADAGGADIPLPEVGSTANLSTVTGVAFIAIGA